VEKLMRMMENKRSVIEARMSAFFIVLQLALSPSLVKLDSPAVCWARTPPLLFRNRCPKEPYSDLCSSALGAVVKVS
jgi:hypothetical protein